MCCQGVGVARSRRFLGGVGLQRTPGVGVESFSSDSGNPQNEFLWLVATITKMFISKKFFAPFFAITDIWQPDVIHVTLRSRSQKFYLRLRNPVRYPIPMSCEGSVKFIRNTENFAIRIEMSLSEFLWKLLSYALLKMLSLFYTRCALGIRTVLQNLCTVCVSVQAIAMLLLHQSLFEDVDAEQPTMGVFNQSKVPVDRSTCIFLV